MESISLVNSLLMLGALLVLVGIGSSLIATRFGAPLLLVFLIVGMLAGEDGPGGIPFSNFTLAYSLGSLALSIILFDGGLRTRISAFRGITVPSLLLATVGVVISSALTAAFAMLVLHLTFLEGMLLGAIVSSTDAAAVFFLLRTGGTRLRHKVGATLEIESGTNDPTSVFLTLMIVEVLLAPTEGGFARVIEFLTLQVAVGAIVGIGGGLGFAALINRVDFPSGLHPVLVIAGAVFLYAAASLLDGSGFLAAYLAGLVMGNRPLRAYGSIMSFHDAATWLFQIMMFLVLGLLVTPSDLLNYGLAAIAIAVFLILIGRPIAVIACLAPFGFRRSEIAFVSWVGLRGAVSIFLASIPMMSGLPNAAIIFNVAFVVVLISLLVQGWTIRPLALRLGLALPHDAPQVSRVELDLPGQLEYELVGFTVAERSPVVNGRKIPAWARPVLVVREGEILGAAAAGSPRSDDHIYVLAPPWRVDSLDPLFAPPSEVEEQIPSTEFIFNGTAKASTIADLYRIAIPDERKDWTVAEWFIAELGEDVAEDDQIAFGDAALFARRVRDGLVVLAALRIDDAGAWLRPIATRAEAKLSTWASWLSQRPNFGRKPGTKN
jgi:potassium/hydrogen antiporter